MLTKVSKGIYESRSFDWRRLEVASTIIGEVVIIWKSGIEQNFKGGGGHLITNKSLSIFEPLEDMLPNIFHL